MRRHRWALTAAACLVAVTGCSSSGSDDSSVTVPTTVGTVTQPTRTTAAPQRTTEQVELEPMLPLRVDMSVVAASSGVDAEIGAAVDPAALDRAEPFGTFASCSGARRSFGPYSVLVSVPDGSITAASVFTGGAVSGPGTHDADIKVELRSGVALTASGTVTIGTDLRSGQFIGFESGGGRVSGSFVCSGGDPMPAPVEASNNAGVLDSVEVVALLRRDGAERVVDLAVDTARSPEVAAECPVSIGGSGPLLARVDGGQSVGAITTFELTDGAAPTMRFRVGGADYVFDEVSVTIADPPSSGTFSATADGVTVDGAFRCR